MLTGLPRTEIFNVELKWERDLADFRSQIVNFGKRFRKFEEIHPRLFVMTGDRHKVAVRQSPFDEMLRLFVESFDPDEARAILADLREILE